MLDLGLYLLYLLLGLAVLAAIGFAVYNALNSKRALMGSLVGVGALVVLFGISYTLSGSEVTAKNAALGVTEGTSKLVGAGLIMFYITLILAVLALIYSEVSKAIK